MSTKQNDREYIANTYARFDLEIDSLESGIANAEGREYIDFGTGIGVTVFGAGDKVWTDAVCEQAKKLPHASNLYYTKPCTDLAKLLCEKTGMKKVFFGNSGAEANECALKCARKYSYDKYGEGRKKIITLQNSFHGRTLFTLSATGQDVFHQFFGPFVEGFEFVPANDTEALAAAMTEDTCALMLECVQGEGGVNCLSAEYLAAAQKMCAERDVLLIIDEVQTGNGRTGSLYSYMQFGLSPDIVTTAKGLGGGLPIGACLLGDKVKDTLGASSHGSTFGGNPIACAGALTVIERLDGDFLSDVRERAKYLWDRLSELENVKSISGLGFMIGLEVEDNKKFIADCMKEGLLVLSAKSKVRLLPPINVSRETIDRAIEIMKNAGA